MKDCIEKTMWIDPELDFEDLYQDGHYADIIRLSNENANLMTSLYRHSETGKLKKSLNFGMVMLSYFERSLQENAEISSIFWAGKLKGCLETLDKLQFATDQDKLAVERAKLLGTKHLDEIIFALETHGAMSQSELGESLGLQPSTLSEILKKILKTQLINVSPYGKYKIYSLTGEGTRYGALLRKRSNRHTEIETAIGTVQSYLQNPDTRKDCLAMLNERLSETSDTIISIDNQVAFIDYKHKIITKFLVDQILREIVNLETGPAATTTIFAGSITPPNYYRMDEDVLQNGKVSIS